MQKIIQSSADKRVNTVPFGQSQCPLEKAKMAKWAQITKGQQFTRREIGKVGQF